MKQSAALPYRLTLSGDVEIMLITSRQSGQWLIPKGNLIKGLSAHDSAAQEAFEEAGVSGEISAEALGMFRYNKRNSISIEGDIEVLVFPLLVLNVFEIWPERAQRRRRWRDPISASHLVQNNGLRRLLQVFHLNAAVY